MSGPAYHAWTHRPRDQGGTDPIEIEAGVEIWPHLQHIPLLTGGFDIWTGGTNDVGLVVVNNNQLHNGWITNKAPGSSDSGWADGSITGFTVLLGPENKTFMLQGLARTGPDAPILKFDLAHTGLCPPDDPTGLDNYSSNWVPWFGMDCYSSSAEYNQRWDNSGTEIPFTSYGNVACTIRATGARGTTLTSITSSASNGGPGWYGVRIKVDGKNASSSGYRLALSELNFVRSQGWGA